MLMFNFFWLGGCKIFEVVPIIIAGLGEVCLFRRSWIGGVGAQVSQRGATESNVLGKLGSSDVPCNLSIKTNSKGV